MRAGIREHLRTVVIDIYTSKHNIEQYTEYNVFVLLQDK